MMGVQESLQKVTTAWYPHQWDSLRGAFLQGALLDTVPRFDFTAWTILEDFRSILDQLEQRIERGESGRAVLEEMNDPWLTASFDAIEFADWLAESAEDRQESLDETAEGLLSDPEFLGEVREFIESLELTRPRWRLIERALRARTIRLQFPCSCRSLRASTQIC